MGKIKIISWNINGIRTRAKNKEIDPVYGENPDIILFQETKAKYEQLDSNLKNIEGYNTYFSPGETTRTGGIATFSKLKPKLVKRFFDVPDSSLKMRVLNFKFDKFTLIHIYAPYGFNSKADKEIKLSFYNKLLEFAEKSADDNVIIAGDFNIAHSEKDISDPEKASKNSSFFDEERDIINKIEKLGYFDSFRLLNPDEIEFSAWKSQKAKESDEGSRLDYFFISKSLKDSLIESKILSDINGSKHAPIELVIDI
ncbi:exodeoxyribonuclease III [Methanobrevibacter arboriphilus JCM 13429 = DSM 1125]|uniref:Exodeoxyribonuclease III n=1 Tax=Methanobrevibacter arboriphilus JCM 13429 = DSM 1125 TaxID=1300164 RepID=A0A1V6N171_METAZ|nr:exodeoxyribonuclease III [Methanobrevibacter arboriphilus]OQD58357.1 exodeoxyribonuclease III [Methanobrevibacter arboriphilus JCM 13429 = DSM 1125]